ncbi:MAG: arsenate reductase (glutaredoxin) [Myxococcales bacterium]|nr:arsenate reductase (glutaredoxin) [Myxococcales bacterium]
MAKVTIWHNPRCSKSRQTLQLLIDHGVEPDVIEYLKSPPSAAELDSVLDKLGFEPRELMRTKEAVYTELSLNNEALTHDDLIAAMIEHPTLIERPVVIVNNRAALGRPPENVLALAVGPAGT